MIGFKVVSARQTLHAGVGTPVPAKHTPSMPGPAEPSRSSHAPPRATLCGPDLDPCDREVGERLQQPRAAPDQEPRMLACPVAHHVTSAPGDVGTQSPGGCAGLAAQHGSPQKATPHHTRTHQTLPGSLPVAVGLYIMHHAARCATRQQPS